MKLPLLVLSLAVLYWACVIGAEEDVNSTGDVMNPDEQYTSDYQDVFLERSLSRSKRSILIKPMASMALKMFGKSLGIMFPVGFKIFKPALKMCFYGYSVLIGLQKCPSVELSINMVMKNLVTKPFTTIQTVMCYILDKIGSTGRKILLKAIEKSIQFTRKTLIPGLDTVLMKVRNTGYLPSTINTLIDMFHTVCVLMKMMKIIG